MTPETLGERQVIVSKVADRLAAIENRIERGRAMVANGHAEISEAMMALQDESLHVEAGYPNIYAYAMDKWGFDARKVDRYLATARMIKRNPEGRAAQGAACIEEVLTARVADLPADNAYRVAVEKQVAAIVHDSMIDPGGAKKRAEIVERRSARIPIPVNVAKVSTTTVYLIGNAANNLVKIGISVDVTKRLGDLRTGSPVRLDLLATFPGYGTEEKWLHSHPAIAPHHSHGEWFALGPDAVEIVRTLLQED